MNHRETVAAIARKLRHFTQRDVSEMLDALIEVWGEELIKSDSYVRIEGLGKLYIEQQSIRSTGAVRATLAKKHKTAPTMLNRYYFRFHAAESLRRKLIAFREPDKKQEACP